MTLTGELKQKNLVGYFFNAPYIFLWTYVILAFTDLAYSQQLSNLYTKLLLVGFIGWLILVLQNRDTIPINAQFNNTGQSIAISMIAFVVFTAVVIFLSSLFSSAGSSLVGSNPAQAISNFFSTQSTLFIGASAKPILENSPLYGTFIFGWLIPLIETFATIIMVAIFMLIFNVQQGVGKFGIARQPKFFAIASIVATIITVLHIQAKGIGSDIALLIVFLFFLLTCYLAVIPFVGNKREQEIPIYLHITNNTLAVGKALRLF